MSNMTSIKFSVMVGDSHFCSKFQVIEFKATVEKRVVKFVSVVTSDDVWIVVLNELSKSEESIFF